MRRAFLAASALLLSVACQPGADDTSADASAALDGTAPADASSPLDAGIATDADAPIDAMEAADAGSEPISFARDVWRILQARCSNCHGTLSLGGLMLGTTPESAHAALVGVSTTHGAACPLPSRVVPGDPDSSLLLRSVDGLLPEGCGEPMPLAPNAPLSASDRATIRVWIEQGAGAN